MLIFQEYLFLKPYPKVSPISYPKFSSMSVPKILSHHLTFGRILYISKNLKTIFEVMENDIKKILGIYKWKYLKTICN